MGLLLSRISIYPVNTPRHVDGTFNIFYSTESDVDILTQDTLPWNVKLFMGYIEIRDSNSPYCYTIFSMSNQSLRETVYIIKLIEYDKQKLTNMFVEELLDFLKMGWSIGHIRFV